MKKIIVGLTLLASMSSFAESENEALNKQFQAETSALTALSSDDSASKEERCHAYDLRRMYFIGRFQEGMEQETSVSGLSDVIDLMAARSKKLGCI